MTIFKLKVQRIDQTCLFELSWGTGQQRCATLSYPESLSAAYQDWQRVYLSFYKSALRGRVETSGTIAAIPIDWHSRLAQAQAKLLCEFHHWLRSAELFEIRASIASGQFTQGTDNGLQTVDVFLTCTPIELARLPWEAWEIGAEEARSASIRIVRTPANIGAEPVAQKNRNTRSRARILAILGDDTKLNFQADKNAVRSLSRVAEIEFIGWQPGQEVAELRDNICAAIADERGWDVLFFAGHSNEAGLIGGELAIAPGASLSINEIAPYLQAAKSRGLQFAIFNSCSGLNIAESLINLGLSQVAVMREPIHNQVAQEFLVRFLQVLAEYKDVQEAMLAACQHLKLQKNITYPSAYLIPSLFCYPNVELFRIPEYRPWKTLQQLLPTRREAIALSALVLISLSLSAQDFLLEQRVFFQAVYRQVTNQIPTATPPPVLLVQINEKSIQEAKIPNPKPMDRNYLASLVDRLSALNAKVVGIDYLLDRPHGDSDRKLAQSLQAAVQRQPQATWFVFPEVRDNSKQWLGVLPEIASPTWSMQGHIHLLQWYMRLVPEEDSLRQPLPFAYLLALAYKLNVEMPQEAQGNKQEFPQSKIAPGGKKKGGNPTSKILLPPQPQLQSQTNFFSQQKDYITQVKGQDYKTLFSPTSRLGPITSFSYGLGQMWLHPIIDFSIPPDRVYTSIPAWQLLQANANSPQVAAIQQQVAIVVPWAYGESGVFADGQDNFSLPAAVRYWLNLASSPDRPQVLPGGEAHAYMIHHFLTQRLVVPIPDLWTIGIAAVLGKVTALLRALHLSKKSGVGRQILGTNPLALRRLHHVRLGWTMLLSLTPAVYGAVSLQVYISAAILLPWFLPSLTFWTFALPPLLRKKPYA